MKFKILNVIGARPNFMKIAPIIMEMGRYPDKIIPLLVHTGQHFDYEMSRLFFEDLKLPEPDFYLRVGPDSHARQTAKIMQRFEKVLLRTRPHLVLLVGDVNSTVSCALCAAKMQIPIVHVEAGLRSFDKTMPEEINRILTDDLSDFLFITEESARVNLLREGICKDNIYFVGNVMIDTLLNLGKTSDKSNILERLRLKKKRYAVLTLHRPSNVDTKKIFKGMLKALCEIQKDITVVWPIHPRSKKMIDRFKLDDYISRMSNFKVVPAMGYLDFLKLVKNSLFVLTDSGGIQEETTVLKIPCITLRKNTERPVTVEKGTNIIVGQDRDRIVKQGLQIMSNGVTKTQIPKFWDGNAAKRIVSILIRELGERYGAS